MSHFAAITGQLRAMPDTTTRKGLWSFVIKEKENRKYINIFVLTTPVLFFLFKLLYPFPDFISDSYNYIESAALHLNVNLWPIGYAKFLWIVHQLSYSDNVLVSVQYGLEMISLIYFFFSMLYLYRPSRSTRNILFVFLFFNPLFPYLANCVLSDAIFLSLSIVWFIQLLWMMCHPRRYHLITLAILTGILFTIRYTAMYYPFVALVAFLMSKLKWQWKLVGILAPWVAIIPFVLFTMKKTKEVTGSAEFSVFGSWQIANNALYMYDHIQVTSKELPPASVELDRMVKNYFKWAPPGYFNFDDFPGTFFIKHGEAPLKQYMILKHGKDPNFGGFQSWGKVSPIYNAYGNYLIMHHPMAFAKYYLWLNVKNYFDPYLEKFGSYNIDMDSVWFPAQYWFHYKEPAVRVVSKRLHGALFFAYPSVFMILNFYFAGAFCWQVTTRRFRRLSPMFWQAILLMIGYLLLNFGFSVFATPVVLRYQVMPFILLFTFSLFLLEFTDKSTQRA